MQNLRRIENTDMNQLKKNTAYYHLPGLFEFYELYHVFLPLFREHREYFYDWCEIVSGVEAVLRSGITIRRRFLR